MPDSPPSNHRLPIAVTVGFAGSRKLLDSDSTLTEAQRLEFESAVSEVVQNDLRHLHRELHLSPHHFLCGLSQIAIGGDFAFTRACAALRIPQRIFLPQPIDEYLEAKSSDAVADFSPEQKTVARKLLDDPHIVHVQVASDSHDRTDRFEDTNVEILRASDVVICLMRASSAGRAGGTLDVLADAKQLGKPVLEIHVSEENGRPQFKHQWDHPKPKWEPPFLPGDLGNAILSPDPPSEALGIPVDAPRYLGVLKGVGSRLANLQRSFFKIIALVIIGSHLLATLCAVIGMALHQSHGEQHGHLPWIPILIGLEISLIATGLAVHFYLHHSNTVRNWAMSRLCAEIARSVGALQHTHVSLKYLFTLPFPKELLPLLQTINILHLASKPSTADSWEKRRDRYLENRLDRKNAQLDYYAKGLANARTWSKVASYCFIVGSGTAFLASVGEMVLHVNHAPIEQLIALGSFAILMPVVAVAALSLAASFDLEARVHTYHDTLEFLTAIRPHFNAARSERAFVHLALETESRLLGETATWASRRSFTSVA